MTAVETTPASHWYGSLFRYSPISLFAAGFISVLVFQQGAVAILNAVGFTPATPFSTSRTWPLDVPQIWSFAFWGGVWGLVYGFFEKWFPSSSERTFRRWSCGSSSSRSKVNRLRQAGIRCGWPFMS